MASQRRIGVVARTSARRSRAARAASTPWPEPSTSMMRAAVHGVAATPRRRRRPSRRDRARAPRPAASGAPRRGGRSTKRDHDRRSPARAANRSRTASARRCDRAEAGAGAAGGRVAVLHAAARSRPCRAAIERQQLEPGAARRRRSCAAWMWPPPPCFSRLVASSVTTIATLVDARRRGSPMRRARSPPAGGPRQPGSASATAVNIAHVQRASVTTVPCPGADVMSNSLRQPLGAAEAEAQAAAGRVAVLQRQRDVGDARALVGEGQAHAAAPAVAQHLDAQRAAAAVVDRVAAELARRGDDLGLIDQAEAGGDRARPHRLPHPHDVVGGAERHGLIDLGLHRRARGCR